MDFRKVIVQHLSLGFDMRQGHFHPADVITFGSCLVGHPVDIVTNNIAVPAFGNFTAKPFGHAPVQLEIGFGKFHRSFSGGIMTIGSDEYKLQDNSCDYNECKSYEFTAAIHLTYLLFDHQAV
jgi:hypothetical protein